MISLDNTSTTTNPPPTNQTNNITIFECSDFRRDTGLLLLKQKKDPSNKFELHLHDDYTNQAIAMILDIKDFARMFEALDEYFLKAQIENKE
jgi:hypothetical protein